MPGQGTRTGAGGAVGAADVVSGIRRTLTNSPVRDISLHAAAFLPILRCRKTRGQGGAPRFGLLTLPLFLHVHVAVPSAERPKGERESENPEKDEGG